MDRRAIPLLLLLLLCAGVAGDACVDHDPARVAVTRVIDGDTVTVELLHDPLPEPLSNVLRLRIRGVDTPETHRPRCAAEAQRGAAATDFVADLLRQRPPPRVRLCGWACAGRGDPHPAHPRQIRRQGAG